MIDMFRPLNGNHSVFCIITVVKNTVGFVQEQISASGL